jgi:hypothetical protein
MIDDGELIRERWIRNEPEEIHRGLTDVIGQNSVEGTEKNLLNIWDRIAAIPAVV